MSTRTSQQMILIANSRRMIVAIKMGDQKVEEIINVFKPERNGQLWRYRCRKEKPEEGCERTHCVQLSLVMNICGTRHRNVGMRKLKGPDVN